MNIESQIKMNLANKITILRIILIPLFIWFILAYRISLKPNAELLRLGAIVVFFTATISDGLDGFIARVKKQKTELGAILDPLADKLLLSTAVILFSFKIADFFQLPLWFAIMVVSRDIIIVSGAFLIHFIKGSLKVVPSPLGKVTTFFQMALVVWILLKFPYSQILLLLAAFFTVFSGAHYIYAGSKQLS